MDEQTKKSIIRGSVNWVKSFKIENVKGDPDLLHKELNDLEYLIVSKLPYTISAWAKEYEKKLDEYSQLTRELFKIMRRLDELEEYSLELQGLIEIQKLYQKIKNYFKDIENNGSFGENEEEDKKETLQDFYKEYIRLIKNRDEKDINQNKLNDINRIEDILLDLNYNKKKHDNLKNLLDTYKNGIKRNCYKFDKLRGELVVIKNDINTIQKNSFKSLAITEPDSMTETIAVPGEKLLRIDHAKSTVQKKPDKDKTFSENFVFASLTFIIESNHKQQEISIPVKVPNSGVVNLSYFKTTEYMSLEIGSTYNSSNDFLMHQIEYRYKKGAAKDNIPMPKNFGNSQSFSHSEQALFFALENKDVRELTAKRLKEKIASKDIKSITIKIIVIDLHTSRYICDNCTVSALGVQHDKALPSLKKLIESSVKAIMPDINFDPNCFVHTRASAGIDFETQKKSAEDHNKKMTLMTLKSDLISEKDMRIDNSPREILAGREHYLSKELLRYTLFTSSDTENQKFKTTYARVAHQAIDDAARKIQRSYKDFKNRNKG